MSHFCKIFGRTRPNEKFSEKGHKTHVCTECHRLPKDERERIDLEAELSGILKQSRISKKNVKRLQELTGHSDPDVSKRAELMIRVAKIAEGKRKRWRKVCQIDRALFFACGEAGLLEHWIPEDEFRATGALWEHDDEPDDYWGYNDRAGLVEMEDNLLLSEGIYRELSQVDEEIDHGSRREDSWKEGE